MVYLVRLIINIIADTTVPNGTTTTPAATFRSATVVIDSLASSFTLVITLVMVAVPEGLPLAIVMSLAYSVLRMNDDGVLVKNLTSPEVMGRVEEICTGKTGTLTTGEMKINQFYS